jgi:hypothetical protein
MIGFFNAQLAALALAFSFIACNTTGTRDSGSEGKEAESDDFEETVVSMPANAAGETIISAQKFDLNGVPQGAKVYIAEDNNSIMAVMGKEIEVLGWDGEILDCPCRTFHNDKYIAYVTYPHDKHVASAAVYEVQVGVDLIVPGELDVPSIEHKEPHSVKVSINSNLDEVSFEYDDEVYELIWDKKHLPCNCRNYKNDQFEATVWWPNKGRSGSAKVVMLTANPEEGELLGPE